MRIKIDDIRVLRRETSKMVGIMEVIDASLYLMEGNVDYRDKHSDVLLKNLDIAREIAEYYVTVLQSVKLRFGNAEAEPAPGEG